MSCCAKPSSGEDDLERTVRELERGASELERNGTRPETPHPPAETRMRS